jgi:hypothetical protein
VGGPALVFFLGAPLRASANLMQLVTQGIALLGLAAPVFRADEVRDLSTGEIP